MNKAERKRVKATLQKVKAAASSGTSAATAAAAVPSTKAPPSQQWPESQLQPRVSKRPSGASSSTDTMASASAKARPSTVAPAAGVGRTIMPVPKGATVAANTFTDYRIRAALAQGAEPPPIVRYAGKAPAPAKADPATPRGSLSRDPALRVTPQGPKRGRSATPNPILSTGAAPPATFVPPKAKSKSRPSSKDANKIGGRKGGQS